MRAPVAADGNSSTCIAVARLGGTEGGRGFALHLGPILAVVGCVQKTLHSELL